MYIVVQEKGVVSNIFFAEANTKRKPLTKTENKTLKNESTHTILLMAALPLQRLCFAVALVWTLTTTATLSSVVASKTLSDDDDKSFVAVYYPQGMNCTGLPLQTSNMSFNQCYSGQTENSKRTTSVMYYPAPKSMQNGATCATINLYESNVSSCNGALKLRMSFPCGVCQHDADPVVGRYIWECHNEAKYVVRKVKCNQDCSACGVETPIGLSGCVPVGGLWGSLGLEELFKCRFIQQQDFVGNTSSSTSKCLRSDAQPLWRPICNRCEDAVVKYLC